jgi:hypothetical protein
MTKINVGDIVTRAYPLSIYHNLLGFVVDRDNNDYLSIMWGSKLEHMWDDGDLNLVSSFHIVLKDDI